MVVIHAYFLVSWVVVIALALVQIVVVQMHFMHEAEGKEGQH